jgi:hypothetical protein
MAAFLPIVERELRVAARKRSSFWVRIAAALVAFVIGTAFLILSRVAFGMGPTTWGPGLFSALTWLCLGVVLSAGLFLTSDCLSEEKRSGTIGFLFLTDLRGYDVVLGKLLATSLRGLCAVLGVLPILAVTLLMGGVTGEQFWKTSLALLNALFLSLGAGLVVSGLCRESPKALGGTLLLIIGLIAIGPISDSILAAVRHSVFNPVFSLSSPGYLFVLAGAWGRNPFWRALLLNQMIGWFLLGLSSLMLPHLWQEAAGKIGATGTFMYRWKFGGRNRRARLRAKLMDINPVFWLACRERWQALSVWVMTVLLTAIAGTIIISGRPSFLWMAWGQTSGALTLLLYLGFASQSARFFVDAQRNGVLELLLATPLSIEQIIHGQWRALGRMLGLPIALFLAAECAGGFVAQERAWSQMTAAIPAGATTTPSATNPPPIKATGSNTTVTLKTGKLSGATFSGPGFTLPQGAIVLGIAVASTCSLLGNFVALIWFGMWMGLTSKTLNLATLKTIVFVQIVPWFVLSFATALVIPLLLIPVFFNRGSVGPQTMMWFPWIASGSATVLSLAKDIGFCLWARKKLYSKFRDCAVQVVAGIRPVAPPVLAPVQPPPVIS